MKEADLEMVVMTFDKEGAAVYDLHHGFISQKGLKIKEVDGAGAGDCFMGYFLTAMIKGYSKKEALVIENKAGSVKATRMGTTNIPIWDEVVK